MFRQLQKNDYYKNYFGLLSQLTESPKISYDCFINIYEDIQNSSNHYIYVLEYANEIVVSGTIIFENKFIHNGLKVAHIEDIIVDKKMRGKGLGYSIIEYLIEIAKKEMCYKIVLDCSDDYVNFYKKIGFTRKNNQMAIYFNYE